MSKRKLSFPATVEGGNSETKDHQNQRRAIELGDESQVIYFPKFPNFEDSWKWLDYLNREIPWTRSTIRVFGRSCLQPQDTCNVATPGLHELVYNRYQPRTYFWDDFSIR